MTEPPQRSDTSFRRRFAELSLEKKLSIFFVPVFAAVVGTLVPRFLGDGGGDSPAPEPREEKLEVVSLQTVNKPKSEVAKIELIVRNTGVVDSVIRSAEFRVVDYAAAEACYVPEGQLDVSGKYDLVLPVRDGGGKSFDVDLQQAIPAGEGDRFSFTVQVRGDFVPIASRLYALETLLYHDQSDDPLPAGVARVAVPFPLWEGFVYPEQGPYGGYFDPECPARNSALLADFLARDGVRSDELEAFGADPEVFLEFEPKRLPAPTDADLELASAAAARLVQDLADGRLREACESVDPDSMTSITDLVGAPCPEWISQFEDLLAAGGSDSLSVSEAHPGWIRIVAPEDNEGHQLVIVLQTTPQSLARKRFEWVVTNLYDAAAGPIDLSGEEPASAQ